MVKNDAARVCVAIALAGALLGCPSPSAGAPDYQGIVEYEERVLAFELPGRVKRVDVKRGDVVADQQPLAEVDATLEKLSRDARASEIETARADVALLEAGAKREDVAALAAQVRAAVATEGLIQKNAERPRALHESGSIAQAELDRLESDVERTTAERKSLEQRLASLQRGPRSEELSRARARLEGATAAVALADERLARYVLRAQAPGDVLDVHLEPGELAGAGAPVVTLADTTHPYVEVFVPQGDLGGIRAGAKATVRVDAAKESLGAAVEHVGTRTEFTPRYIFSERERPNLVVRVRVRVDDPQKKLHAGVPAFVAIGR
ncbi:efflux RND transporter periplasmic adaptor subunit [soil metagenome]